MRGADGIESSRRGGGVPIRGNGAPPPSSVLATRIKLFRERRRPPAPYPPPRPEWTTQACGGRHKGSGTPYRNERRKGKGGRSKEPPSSCSSCSSCSWTGGAPVPPNAQDQSRHVLKRHLKPMKERTRQQAGSGG